MRVIVADCLAASSVAVNTGITMAERTLRMAITLRVSMRVKAIEQRGRDRVTVASAEESARGQP